MGLHNAFSIWIPALIVVGSKFGYIPLIVVGSKFGYIPLIVVGSKFGYPRSSLSAPNFGTPAHRRAHFFCPYSGCAHLYSLVGNNEYYCLMKKIYKVNNEDRDYYGMRKLG